MDGLGSVCGCGCVWGRVCVWGRSCCVWGRVCVGNTVLKGEGDGEGERETGPFPWAVTGLNGRDCEGKGMVERQFGDVLKGDQSQLSSTVGCSGNSASVSGSVSGLLLVKWSRPANRARLVGGSHSVVDFSSSSSSSHSTDSSGLELLLCPVG